MRSDDDESRKQRAAARASWGLRKLAPRRIDLLTEISGIGFDEAWESRRDASIGPMSLPVLGRDVLLKNKSSTGRDKDLADVRALLQLKSD